MGMTLCAHDACWDICLLHAFVSLHVHMLHLCSLIVTMRILALHCALGLSQGALMSLSLSLRAYAG